MARAASEAAVAKLRGDARAQAPDAVDYAAAAWLCALPCAVIVVAAVVLLGPPLGDLLSPAHSPYTFMADYLTAVGREPTEQARFLIALGAPLLMALALALAPRWQPRMPANVAAVVVELTQWVLAALLIACLVAQNRRLYSPMYTLEGTRLTLHYFTPLTLVVAALLAGGSLLVLNRSQLRERAAALLRESRARRIAALLAAVAMTVVWLLHAVQTDRSIGMAPEDVLFHASFTLDETFAVLDGRTPLVDFSAQYSSLWPFVVSLPMLAFGKTMLTFTLTLCVITAVALLAIFGVLRRVTRSSIAALLLYLPFLATSLFMIGGVGANRSSVGTYYGTIPLRYAGPYLLAWLTARHIDRGRPAATLWPLFAVAGLVLLNNGDFGVAALGATVAALLWSAPRPDGALLRRLGIGIAAGLALALLLVSTLTLVRAGSLPQLGRLVDYARMYTIGGYGMMPIGEVLGLHLAVYVTYVAAIAVATVRALRGAADRLLTGMLAWSGIFGLGSASYFIGRSHPVTLKSTFSAWSLALALLTVVVVRHLAANPQRRPSVATVAVLFGFGLAVCSLAQTPAPWSQIERLQAPFAATTESPNPSPLVPSTDPATRTFVASLAEGPSDFVVKSGAPVAILLTTGHRIADAYDVVNVSPYTGIHSLPTVQRVNATIDALREAGGNTIVLPNPLTPSIFTVLERRGFQLLTDDGLRDYVPGRTRPAQHPWPGGGTVIKWVDTRNLHPQALR